MFEDIPDALPKDWVRSSWSTWLKRWPLLRHEVVDWLIDEYCSTPLGHITVKFRPLVWRGPIEGFLTEQGRTYEAGFVSTAFVSVPVTRFYERYEHLRAIKSKAGLPYSLFQAAEGRGNGGVYSTCPASKALHNQTFDPSKRPEIPLKDCTQPNCKCCFCGLTVGMLKRRGLRGYDE
jgi:hypothetical protein